MDRRTFIRTFGISVAVAPLAAEAQPARKVWRIGILVSANPRIYDGLVQELRRLGYVDSQNLALEFRNAQGQLARFPTLAAELVKAGVDAIVVAGGEAPLKAVQEATTAIPIVIVAIDYDPLALGNVASLAQPGGNITGLSLQQTEVTAKRIELLKAMLPKAKRLAILWEPTATEQYEAAGAASRSLGLRVQSLEIRHSSQDFHNAFAAAAKERVDAVFVVTTAIFYRERAQIAKLALANRLPSVFALREWVEAGGLMSYGTNLSEMVRRAAAYVDKILKGVKPGDLPIEQATKFELVINLKTAKALGLTIPPSLLLRADQVIQ